MVVYVSKRQPCARWPWPNPMPVGLVQLPLWPDPSRSKLIPVARASLVQVVGASLVPVGLAWPIPVGLAWAAPLGMAQPGPGWRGLACPGCQSQPCPSWCDLARPRLTWLGLPWLFAQLIPGCSSLAQYCSLWPPGPLSRRCCTSAFYGAIITLTMHSECSLAARDC